MVCFIRFILFIARVATGLLKTENLVEWEFLFCESGAEQDKAAGPPTFRTDHGVGTGKRAECLPDYAAMRAPQSDIHARDQ